MLRAPKMLCTSFVNASSLAREKISDKYKQTFGPFNTSLTEPIINLSLSGQENSKHGLNRGSDPY